MAYITWSTKGVASWQFCSSKPKKLQALRNNLRLRGVEFNLKIQPIDCEMHIICIIKVAALCPLSICTSSIYATQYNQSTIFCWIYVARFSFLLYNYLSNSEVDIPKVFSVENNAADFVSAPSFLLRYIIRGIDKSQNGYNRYLLLSI